MIAAVVTPFYFVEMPCPPYADDAAAFIDAMPHTLSLRLLDFRYFRPAAAS